MNVFGAFTFGSLIKTFIPGLIWVFAMGLLWRDLFALMPGIVPAIPNLAGEEQILLVLAIPAAILLGLLSNIIVFMGINDWLIRNPVRKKAPELFRLYDGLSEEVRREYWVAMKCSNSALEQCFLDFADPEILILKSSGITDLAYVREQYWYHLEFQVNMLLATFCTLPALLASPAVVGAGLTGMTAGRAALEIVIVVGICSLLRSAALKNYSRHVAKMCTLMASNLCERPSADKSAGNATSAAPNP